ncbi:gametocyte-specific factor 1 isoform X1 [Vidua macroura]|uniref:gametocyte-specific factor 1 isoform X1 n=1 Tax=Vidua macroura TaxID=187451 RepID=UPI0023A82987|nr:gametocyte-specific factor 1 isoform X1 [Vidua macroura]
MEPDALVQCPYDRSHQVRESRLPYHLVRCQQNNPQVSRTLATCPFNARHRVPRAHLRDHVTSCPDKLPLELPPDPEDTARPACPPAQDWQPPPCQEDWDAELGELELEEPPPFILHVTKGDLPVPCRSPDPAAPPEGLSPRKPRPATAAPRLETAGATLGTARARLGTAGATRGRAGARLGTARARRLPGARGGLGAEGAPPVFKFLRK